MLLFCRCSCIEPANPSNATLLYWEQNNISAPEIFWEALEVQVRIAVLTFEIPCLSLQLNFTHYVLWELKCLV